jgi:transcriptional regulator with XRE-family HTH domain
MSDKGQMLGTGTLDDLTREILFESPESATAYLRSSWLTSAVQSLVEARRRSGLTQREVAERLATTQSAIARLESDYDGRMSLHRYIDYLIACSQAPFDIETTQLHQLRVFAIARPSGPRTARCCMDWAREANRITYTEAPINSMLPGHAKLLPTQDRLLGNLPSTGSSEITDDVASTADQAGKGRYVNA